MVFGAILFCTLALGPDQGGWHAYAPKDTGIQFQMPGTVRVDGLPANAAAGDTITRYRAAYNGRTYMIVVGDAGTATAFTYRKLWEGDKSSPAIKKLLGTTIESGRAERKAKLAMQKFGDRNGFPVEMGILENPDGTGCITAAFFTPRGIVFAGVWGPRSEATADEGLKLVNSINLSGRR